MLVAEATNRRIGLEVELLIPAIGDTSADAARRTLADILTINGLRSVSRPYSSLALPQGTDIGIEYDGSLSGSAPFAGVSFHPVELKTRPFVMSEFDHFAKALPILRYFGGTTNKTCSVHVHVDLPEFKDDPRVVRSIFNLFQRFENLIFKLVAPSRTGNQYCKPLPPEPRVLHGCRSARCFRRVLSGYDRYYGVNFTNVWAAEPHLEIRHHGGSLDAEKIKYWALFCTRMVGHATARNCQAAREQTKVELKAFDNFLMTTGFRANSGIYSKVSPELRETAKYLRKRFVQFTSPGGLSGEDSESR